jgi:ubiquinone biosynthesis protein UbiJ
MLKDFMLARAQAVLNAALAKDPDVSDLIAPLRGKTLQVEITDFNLTVNVEAIENELHLSGGTQDADLTLQGKLFDLAHLGVAEDPQTLLSSGAVKLTGSTALLQAYQKFMGQLHIDWESVLAKLVGKSAAAHLASELKRFLSHQKQNCKSTRADITEYLQEEIRVLPSHQEVEDHIEAIDTLKADVARFEARIAAHHKKPV